MFKVRGLDGLLGQEVADPLVGVDPGPADGALVALSLVGASWSRKANDPLSP